MKIIAVYFDRKNKYKRLLKVFQRSARVYMPKVKQQILTPRIPKDISRKHDMGYAFNVTAESAISSKDFCIVCDIDLMFIKSVEDVFKLDFDVAVTVREKYKYNTGIWFCKPTFEANNFITSWIFNNRYLMKHYREDFAHDLISIYAGIDQAALAMTIEKNKTAKVLELPCVEWNACQGEWKDINDNTRVIHVKSALRSVAMKNKQIKEGQEYLLPLAELWRRYL